VNQSEFEKELSEKHLPLILHYANYQTKKKTMEQENNRKITLENVPLMVRDRYKCREYYSYNKYYKPISRTLLIGKDNG